jgi:DNA-directed RNA polymerase specialized sigma24 family protein
VERADAVERLPSTYAAALRLVDGGASHAEIAATFGIAVDAVPGLILIGEQKLAAILVSEPDAGAVVASEPVPIVVREQPDDG